MRWLTLLFSPLLLCSICLGQATLVNPGESGFVAGMSLSKNDELSITSFNFGGFFNGRADLSMALGVVRDRGTTGSAFAFNAAGYPVRVGKGANFVSIGVGMGLESVMSGRAETFPKAGIGLSANLKPVPSLLVQPVVGYIRVIKERIQNPNAGEAGLTLAFGKPDSDIFAISSGLLFNRERPSFFFGFNYIFRESSKKLTPDDYTGGKIKWED
jgi:hypothetical protein